MSHNKNYKIDPPDPPNVPRTRGVSLAELREWLKAAPGLRDNSPAVFARTVQLDREDTRPLPRPDTTIRQLADTIGGRLEELQKPQPELSAGIEAQLAELERRVHEGLPRLKQPEAPSEDA